MRTVHIIGTGMNSPTADANRLISSCDILIGSPRLLEMYRHLDKRSYAGYKPEAVRRIISQSEAESFAVLVSGDVGFYSAAHRLAEALAEFDVRLAEGVPSVCSLCARLKLPWQDAALVSMHGTEGPLVSAVRRNRLTFCLTGGNTDAIGALLDGAGFGGLTVHAGENLGYPDETVFTGKAAMLKKTRPMTVLLIENENPDAAVPAGLPDTEFLREDGVPMTKSEVRAVIMSKLRLKSGSVVYDIGAGTGSVTVEAALAAYNGRVYAVERDSTACGLIEKNCRSFRTGGVTVINGSAPEALDGLPVPDAVFIGGSGGAIDAIIEAVLKKNRSARLVITAIALESAYSALTALENAGVSGIELIQMNVSRAGKRGGLNMLFAQNPIFIISGGGI